MTASKQLCRCSGLQALNTALVNHMVISLKIAVAAVLFGYIAWYLDPVVLWAAASEVSKLQWLVCGLLALLGIGVQWLKWQQLARTKIPELSWSDGLYSLLGGAALGFLTPGRIGEVGRGVFIGQERASLFLLAAADKLSSVVITLCLGWLCAWALWPIYRLWLFLALIPMAIVLWWAWGRWGRSRLTEMRALSCWGNILSLSLVFNLLFMFQFYWAFGQGAELNLVVVLAIPVVFALKALLPIAFMDIGVREAAVVVVFSALDLAAQPAFVASVMLFICNVCLPAVLGCMWIAWRQASVNKRMDMIRKVAL